MTKSKVILKIIVFQLMALSFLLAWTNIYSESQTVKHEMKVDLSWIGISSHKLTSLDVKSISGKQAASNVSAPLYIFREGRGRMGNILFYFASTFCIARHHGRKTLWGADMRKDLLHLFPRLRRLMVFAKRKPKWPSVPHRNAPWDPSLLNKPLPNKNLTLTGFTFSYRLFDRCWDELHGWMRLDPKLVRDVTRYINFTKRNYIKRNPQVNPDVVSVVGIHVRRGDKLNRKYQTAQYGYRVATASEILKAMNYMRHKHGPAVLFIIASDDKEWCRQNLVTSTDTFVSNFTCKFKDFASLVLSNHVIFTEGTFGWWAAWLLEQRVVRDSSYIRRPDILFNKYPFRNGTRLAKIFVRENMYPPSWKTYTEHSVYT